MAKQQKTGRKAGQSAGTAPLKKILIAGDTGTAVTFLVLRRVSGLLCLRNDPGSQLQKEWLVLRALHRNGLLSHLSGRRTAERAVRLHRHGRYQAGMLHPCWLLRRVSWHSSGRAKAHPPPGLTKKLRINAELFSYIAAKPHIMFYHRSKRGTSYVDVSTSRQHSRAAGEGASGSRALFSSPTATFLRAFPNPERRSAASSECIQPRTALYRRGAGPKVA